MRAIKRHEFRFRQFASDGRCYLDVPASAEMVADYDCPFGDVYLNGAPISGVMLRVVHEHMVASGVVEEMRQLLRSNS